MDGIGSVFDKGFWATLVGAVIGGAAGVVPGGFVGELFVPDGAGLEGLLTLFAGAAIGGWLGAAGGAYLALRLLGVPAPGATAGWLALATPVVTGGGFWLAVTLSDADDFGSNFLPYCIGVGSVLLTVYLARLASTTLSEDRSL